MSTPMILLIAGLSVLLLGAFVVTFVHEVRVSPPGTRPFRGLLPVPDHPAPLETPAVRPVRILVATDGSPCSDRAVLSVAGRPWPAGTTIEVITAVHARVPAVADLELMLEAAHVDQLDADREGAPGLVERARRCLAEGAPGLAVSSTVLEGTPETVILEEARRLQADLIVVGSHGRGVVTRHLLGSVSQAVALHAPCSVEIVRCPEALRREISPTDDVESAGAAAS